MLRDHYGMTHDGDMLNTYIGLDPSETYSMSVVQGNKVTAIGVEGGVVEASLTVNGVTIDFTLNGIFYFPDNVDDLTLTNTGSEAASVTLIHA